MKICKATDLADLGTLRNSLRKSKVVTASGCFDIIHSGHLALFEYAASLGDILIVGVNTDESITRLKGLNRPINSLQHRLALIASLHLVDCVVPFQHDTAAEFLQIAKPDYWVKGSDYNLALIHHREVQAVYSSGGRIVFFSTQNKAVIDRQLEQAKNYGIQEHDLEKANVSFGRKRGRKVVVDDVSANANAQTQDTEGGDDKPCADSSRCKNQSS